MPGAALVWDLVARDGASPAFLKVAAAADKAAASTEAASARIARTSDTLLATGRTLTSHFTLPLLGIGAASVKAATDFSTAMERIHTQAGGTQKDVATLSKQVLSLSKTAEQGPTDLANSLYHLKSVGLDNVQAMKALKQSSDLAAVGQGSLEDTTNALAGAWRTGIKGATSFHDAVKTINSIIGAGNMTLTDFTAALGTGILPTAKTFGLTLKDVGSALALFTDEGVPAQQAATRLRMSFSLLGAPSGVAIKQLKSIGISQYELGNDLRKPNGLITAIGDLKKHLDDSGLSATKQAALLSHAFGGGRSSSAILSLINNFDVLKKKQDQVTDSMGRYDQAVAAQRATPQAQFKELEANLERTGVLLGDSVLPGVIKLGNGLTTLSQKFSELSSGTRNLVLFGALGVAALGPLLTIFGRVGQAFSLLVRGFEAVWSGGARVISAVSSAIAADVARTAEAESTAAAIFAKSEASKAAATADAAVDIAASLEGTGSVLTADAEAAANAAIEFAAAMQSQADAASAAAAEIAAASATTVASETAVGTGAAEAASVAGGAAFGPVGLALGAVGAAAVVAAKHFGLFGGSAKNQIQPTDALTNAIRQDNDALGQNTKLLVANALQQNGAYTAGLKLGLSQRTVTRAALGNQTAMQQVNAAIIKNRAITMYAYGGMTAAQKQASDAANKLNGDLGDVAQTLKVNEQAAKNIDKGLGQYKNAADAAAGATRGVKSSLDTLKGLQVKPGVKIDTATAKAQAADVEKTINAIKQGKVPSIDADSRLGRAAVHNLQTYLDSIKQGHEPTVKVLDQASARIIAIQNELNGLHNKTINVTTRHNDVITTTRMNAAGGFIRGPGTGTSDSIPSMLSNGEFVVNAKSTSRNLGLLHAINSGVQRFASGGAVSSTSKSPTNASYTIGGESYSTLAKAIVGITKAFEKAAKQADGLGKAALQGGSSLRSAFSSLRDEAKTAGLSHQELAKLTAIDNQAAIYANRRLAAAQKVAALQQAKAQDVSSIHSAVTGSFDVSTSGTGYAGSSAVSLGSILAQGKQAELIAKKFSAGIVKLRKEGLAVGVVQQLAQAGPSAWPQVQALLTATPKQLRAFNATEAGISSTGSQLGKYVGGAKYGSASDKNSPLGRAVTEQAKESKLLRDELKELRHELAEDRKRREVIEIHIDGKKTQTQLAKAANQNKRRK